MRKAAEVIQPRSVACVVARNAASAVVVSSAPASPRAVCAYEQAGVAGATCCPWAEGYDASWNARFPRAMREPDVRYVVDALHPAASAASVVTSAACCDCSPEPPFADQRARGAAPHRLLERSGARADARARSSAT